MSGDGVSRTEFIRFLDAPQNAMASAGRRILPTAAESLGPIAGSAPQPIRRWFVTGGRFRAALLKSALIEGLLHAARWRSAGFVQSLMTFRLESGEAEVVGVWVPHLPLKIAAVGLPLKGFRQA